MGRVRRWSLRTQVTALCLAVAVALGIIAMSAMVTAVHNRDQLSDVFDRVGPARVDGEQLLTALYQQSSGVLGYAQSGDPADLSQYRSGVAAQRAAETDLARQLSQQPKLGGRTDLRGQASRTAAQLDAWRGAAAEPAIAQVQAGDRAAAQALLASGNASLDAAQSGVNGLRAALLSVRDTTVSQARQGTDRIIQLLIAAALIVVVAGLLLAFLLRMLVIRPVEHLVDDVQAVTAGDYQHQIVPDGPPELMRLSHGVERMRQRIVAELAEASLARSALEAANQQLEQQATELTRSNRDLEQFAYVASHDLQEPLRKVASFCQLLQRRYAGQLDERADQYIHFAVDGAQRMQRLINDLLAFSRIGRHTTGFTEVDLDTAVADIVNQLDATLERSHAEVTWDGLPVVRGEEALLSALLSNLIGNSVKFRRPDAPPRVHLSARRVDDEWEISCQDNGIGIEAEFADKVFVIFQRLHAKDAYPGTGIGLAVAKKIVEYHGGRIWLDSSPQGGSLIKFTLPGATIPDTAAPSPGEHSRSRSLAEASTPNASPDGAADVADAGAPARAAEPAPAVAGAGPAGGTRPDGPAQDASDDFAKESV